MSGELYNQTGQRESSTAQDVRLVSSRQNCCREREGERELGVVVLFLLWKSGRYRARSLTSLSWSARALDRRA
jgi:hypothetical protein